MADATRYAIGDLADLGGVSRRTVRYYVQEGLLPPPHGVGRGNHYGPEHLDQLLRVKTLQETGRTLDEIRRELHQKPGRGPNTHGSQAEPPLHRTSWRRFILAPGVELHVAGTVHLPSQNRLQELANWCRLHFAGGANQDEEPDA